MGETTPKTYNAEDDQHLNHIAEICQEDASGLITAHDSYGNSWKKRGGAGVYLTMIRKFDRMDLTAEKFKYDIFEAVRADPRAEGILDDIRDARRYLVLIEAELRNLGLAEGKSHRDNTVSEDCGCGRGEECLGNRTACRDKKRQELIDAPQDAPHGEGCKCASCRIEATIAANNEECSDHNADCICHICVAKRSRKRGPANDHVAGCMCGPCVASRVGD